MEALAYELPRPEGYERSRQSFEGVVEHLDSEEARLKTHSELERELEKMGRDLMRQLLQDHLDRRGSGETEGPVQGVDGTRRTQVRMHERKFETIFGTVTVDRAGYPREGDKSLHPLDGELNLPPERYSLDMRRRVAEEAAKHSFDETLAGIGKTTAGHVPKRQAEELARRAAKDFAAFYEMRQADATRELTPGAFLVISVDGKGVVMRTEDLREQTRKAAEGARTQDDDKAFQGGEEERQTHGHRRRRLHDRPPGTTTGGYCCPQASGDSLPATASTATEARLGQYRENTRGSH